MARLSRAEKVKFRSRKVWKDFCNDFKKTRDYRCEVCGKDLKDKLSNVHHRFKCETIEEYQDLTDSRFLLLCTDCHKWVHRIYNSPNFKERGFYGL